MSRRFSSKVVRKRSLFAIFFLGEDPDVQRSAPCPPDPDAYLSERQSKTALRINSGEPPARPSIDDQGATQYDHSSQTQIGNSVADLGF